ncbi:hypothetical protein OIO90_002792 [Microbotryomycetes sp. JL221]|nr:hypothetical protein OIO90_002792 [Microbotryomycetes sp. JL221]
MRSTAAVSILFAQAASSLAAPLNAGAVLSSRTLGIIKQQLGNHDSDSWVAGTECQALYELDYRAMSVFASQYTSAINGSVVPSSTNNIIAAWSSKRPSGQTQMAVVPGGAAADPAALGGAWLIASRTVADPMLRSSYRQILDDEVSFQTETQPRSTNGAISMRPASEPVQLWSDFMSMVPPFLAMYGVVSSSQSALDEAVSQCQKYREALRDPTTGLWQHVVLGAWQDNGLWATGNAWAAHGMARVAATLQNSRYSSAYESSIENLRSWTDEILVASMSRLTPSNLVPNYFDKASFTDTAATALLSAASFRLETLKLNQTSTNIENALRMRRAVLSRVDPTTGWVSDCVDPIKWELQTNRSPESLAFVLLMEAAYRDYLAL